VKAKFHRMDGQIKSGHDGWSKRLSGETLQRSSLPFPDTAIHAVLLLLIRCPCLSELCLLKAPLITRTLTRFHRFRAAAFDVSAANVRKTNYKLDREGRSLNANLSNRHRVVVALRERGRRTFQTKQRIGMC